MHGEIIRAGNRPRRINQRPAGARGVEPPWIFAAKTLDPFGKRFLPAAAGLVTRGKQHERRMIAVGPDHALGLLDHHSFHFAAGADFVPHAGLGLKIES
jgi:hypothetical protein